MKRIACALIIVLFAVPACAEDDFIESFNIYAENVFGIPQIEYHGEKAGMDYYTAASFYLYRNESGIAVFGTDAISIISASCCALRCMDNPGSSIDQYGRILHAYFLARSRNTGDKFTAVTESGVNVTLQISDDTVFVWLVK